MSVPKQERRRRRVTDEGEDVVLENATEVTRSSECESEGEGPDIEYESAVDDSADQEDETEEGSETESETEEESGSETETEGYTDEEGLEEERQNGDGEEQPDTNKPDDDEDKKNPAYVPRKGAFYEHDFRQGGEGPETEVPEESKPKKKLWQDEGKWSHDRYVDKLQAPKSRQELIEIYGFDIRTSDKPPEAPPARLRRPKGPQKQHFKDFMPRMAVIDTTDGGQDSVLNLDGDEFFQFSEPFKRSTRRNKMQNADTRRRGRGGSRRGGYLGNDVESMNNRNHPNSNRASKEGQRIVDIPTQDSRIYDDFPSLEESKRQAVPRDVHFGNRDYPSDRVKNDSKFYNERNQKPYTQPETHDLTHRNENRDDNRDRFQPVQDIHRQDDNRRNNRFQQGYKEEKRGGYNRARDGNISREAQSENWRSAPSEFRDGYQRGEGNNRGDGYSRGGRGGYQDYGNSRQRQQQPVTGGSRGPRTNNSGDAVTHLGKDKSGAWGPDQPSHQPQKPNMTGATKEYSNSTYKYPEPKPKPNNATTNSSATPAAGVGGGGSVDDNPSSSSSVVISNKENVQTINVTITNTTTEKKSYAKERRAKGVSRPVEGAVLMGSAADQQNPVVSLPSGQYQPLPLASLHMDLTTPPLPVGVQPYSSHRQQAIFTEPPPVGSAGTKLYNPALPPPSFFQREHGALPPGQHSTHAPSGSVQDPTHFPPALLPPTSALPYGLPVSGTGLPLTPAAAGMPASPAMFQPPTGPTPTNSIAPPTTAMMAAPFIPAGMMYGGRPRVPPPGTPAFPIALAYTSPPPQGGVAAQVVGSQPPPQGAAPAQGIQGAPQHKKVYRGDITYYSPELQQPSRTPQKRPKAAIPIIDPQEIPRQNARPRSDTGSSDAGSSSQDRYLTSNSGNSNLDTSSNSILEFVQKSIPEQGFKFEAKHNIPALPPLSKTISGSLAASHQTSVAASPRDAPPVASQQAQCPTAQDSQTGSSNSVLPGTGCSETKRMSIKTELSPGGPPVHKSMSSTMLPTSRTEHTSLSASLQNLKLETADTCNVEVSSNSKVATTSTSEKCDLKQETDRQVANSGESTTS